MAFESGVASYVVGQATVTVCFPVDLRGNAHVSCSQCEFYSRTSNRCKLNGSLCAFPEKYIGQYCPLIFEEKENNNVPDNL